MTLMPSLRRLLFRGALPGGRTSLSRGKFVEGRTQLSDSVRQRAQSGYFGARNLQRTPLCPWFLDNNRNVEVTAGGAASVLRPTA
jgi:hypothetical protein